MGRRHAGLRVGLGDNMPSRTEGSESSTERFERLTKMSTTDTLPTMARYNHVLSDWSHSIPPKRVCFWSADVFKDMWVVVSEVTRGSRVSLCSDIPNDLATEAECLASIKLSSQDSQRPTVDMPDKLSR